MRFTVVWVPSAEAELANLWMASVDKNASTDSANRIDMVLRDDAHTKGFSLDDQRRVYIDSPLSVIYEVDQADRMVKVQQVVRNK